MAKYRKRPVMIEAVQFTPELALAMLRDNVPGPFGLAISSGSWSERNNTLHEAQTYITIDTLEGAMRCSVGDWVIRGVSGELYPCKPDIFALTYESVQEVAP